jgi:hypothetical protein
MAQFRDRPAHVALRIAQMVFTTIDSADHPERPGMRAPGVLLLLGMKDESRLQKHGGEALRGSPVLFAASCAACLARVFSYAAT